MAGEELTIKGAIEFVLKELGLKEARKKIGEFAKDTKGAATGMEEASRSSAKLAKSFDLQRIGLSQVKSLLLSTFGAGALVALTSSAVEEFQKVSRGISNINADLIRTGKTTRVTFAEVEQLTSELKQISNLSRGELTEGLRQAGQSTSTYAEAQRVLRVATHLTDLDLGSLSENVDRISKLMRGDASSAAAAFGVQLSRADGSLKSAGQIAAEVTPQLERLAAIEPDVSLWHQFLNVMSNPDPVKRDEMAAKAIRDRAAAYSDLIIKQRESAQIDDAASNAKARTALNTRLDAYVDKIAQSTQAAADKRAQIEEAGERDLLKNQIEIAQEGTDARLELELRLHDRIAAAAVAAAKEAGAKTTAIAQAYSIARQGIIDREMAARQAASDGIVEMFTNEGVYERSGLEATADYEADLTEKLRDFRISSLEDYNAEKLQLITDSLNAQEQAEIDSAIQTEGSLKLIHQRYLGLRLAAERNFAAAQVTVQRSSAESQMDIYGQIASASVQLGTAVFGENKTSAIAEAIVNGALAVTKALASASPPYNYILAAIVTALTAAQVEKIKSTERGGGASFSSSGGGGGKKGTFDSPSNDRIALAGSRKSAEDFVRLAQQGIAGGFQAAFGLPVTTNPSGGDAGGSGSVLNVTINGYYNGPASMRALRRDLEYVTRLDKSRQAR